MASARYNHEARLKSAKVEESAEARKTAGGGPMFGCYLCPATTHYCNDRQFHPKANGKYAKVSQQSKDAILARIRGAPASAEAKAAEEKKVRAFWVLHGV